VGSRPRGVLEVRNGALTHLYGAVYSSAPTSKTMAAITAQAPVVVHNLLAHSQGKPLNASCKLLIHLALWPVCS
jgi:hypothetical protein